MNTKNVLVGLITWYLYRTHPYGFMGCSPIYDYLLGGGGWKLPCHLVSPSQQDKNLVISQFPSSMNTTRMPGSVYNCGGRLHNLFFFLSSLIVIIWMSWKQLTGSTWTWLRTSWIMEEILFRLRDLYCRSRGWIRLGNYALSKVSCNLEGFWFRINIEITRLHSSWQPLPKTKLKNKREKRSFGLLLWLWIAKVLHLEINLGSQECALS